MGFLALTQSWTRIATIVAVAGLIFSVGYTLTRPAQAIIEELYDSDTDDSAD